MKTMKKLLEECLIEVNSNQSGILQNLKRIIDNFKVADRNDPEQAKKHLALLKDINKTVSSEEYSKKDITWPQLKTIITKSKKYKNSGDNALDFKHLMQISKGSDRKGKNLLKYYKGS